MTHPQTTKPVHRNNNLTCAATLAKSGDSKNYSVGIIPRKAGLFLSRLLRQKFSDQKNKIRTALNLLLGRFNKSAYGRKTPFTAFVLASP
jgi:hypothetical protein